MKHTYNQEFIDWVNNCIYSDKLELNEYSYKEIAIKYPEDMLNFIQSIIIKYL